MPDKPRGFRQASPGDRLDWLGEILEHRLLTWFLAVFDGNPHPPWDTTEGENPLRRCPVIIRPYIRYGAYWYGSGYFRDRIARLSIAARGAGQGGQGSRPEALATGSGHLDGPGACLNWAASWIRSM